MIEIFDENEEVILTLNEDDFADEATTFRSIVKAVQSMGPDRRIVLSDDEGEVVDSFGM
jgi:hypothetical protein